MREGKNLFSRKLNRKKNVKDLKNEQRCTNIAVCLSFCEKRSQTQQQEQILPDKQAQVALQPSLLVNVPYHHAMFNTFLWSKFEHTFSLNIYFL